MDDRDRVRRAVVRRVDLLVAARTVRDRAVVREVGAGTERAAAVLLALVERDRARLGERGEGRCGEERREQHPGRDEVKQERES